MTEEGAMEVWRLVKSSPGPITMRDAARMLGYANSHGVAKRISAAWGWFDYRGDNVKAAEIAEAFVDQDYKWPWKEN